MIDVERLKKVEKHVKSQIAVAKGIDSDFISLTVGEGKRILEVLELVIKQETNSEK